MIKSIDTEVLYFLDSKFNAYWLVVFCGISTLMGYLMSNPVYKYIYIYDLEIALFSNKPELICSHTVKWLQVLLCKTNIPIYINHLFSYS